MEIVEEIKLKISNGTFLIGAKFPAERVLAEEFQTSRATVREALRALEIIGVIESSVGQGTFVKTTNFSEGDKLSEITHQISPLEVVCY